MIPFDILPPERRDAALAAIRACLGGGEIAAVEHMPGGSALVFRFELGGQGYVLRLEGTGEAPRDNRRAYACMAIAAEARVAPPVIFADADQGLAIMRMISPAPASFAERLGQIGALLRRLHDAPLFPKAAAESDAAAWAMSAMGASDLLPAGARAQIAALYAQVKAAYPADVALASVHHDLNPSNIVFDVERTWFVDWEQACAADPFIDLASVVNWLGGSEPVRDALLAAYFGRAPTPQELARFFLMQQLNRFAYGAVLLISGGASTERVALDEAAWVAAPGLSALGGEMNTLAVHAGRVRFGAAFLKDAIAALESPAFTATVAFDFK